MHFLRYKRMSEIIISLFNDKHNISINNKHFLIKKYYSTKATPLKMQFLDYLISNQSNFNNNISNKQIYDNNSENIKNNDEENSTQLIDINNKTFWNQDKETIMLILQKGNYLELKKHLNKIDKKCCILLNQLSFSEIIQLLNFFMRIDKFNMTSTKFYNDAILTLKIALKRDQLNHQETVTFLFFTSLKKKEGAEDVKFIKKCLPSFNNLSLVEKAILADALFTCSVKLKQYEERSIEKDLENEAESLLNSDYLLIPFCKVIKHAGPSKNFNAENLNRALINSSKHFDLQLCGHVLSLYAEARLKVDSVLLKLYNDTFKYLRYNRFIYRLKDISNIFWAFAKLNYQLNNEDLSEIENLMDLLFRKFRADHINLLNIIISLWMLQYKSKKLIHRCFEKQIFYPIVKNSSDWRSVSQLQLLISCIEIEAPGIEIPSELVHTYDFQAKVKNNLKTIYKKIRSMRHELNLIDLNVINPIKGINIPSVYIKYGDNKIAYVDLLNEDTCLRNSNEPYGLMSLKLRLLTKSGCKSIVIKNEYENDSNKLNEHLHKALM